MVPDDRPHFNLPLFALSQVVVIIATIPAFLPTFAKVLAVHLSGWVNCYILFTQTTGDKGGDLGIGSLLLAHYLVVIDYVLLTRPDDLRDIKDKDTNKLAERSFRSRIVWAIKLYTNPRGIGCVHEVPNIQNRPSPSTPRWKFVVYRATYVVISILALGVACVVNAFNPAFTTPGKVLTDAPLHLRALGVACFAVTGASAISAIHSSLALVTVGCGFSSPERWPYLFGTPLQAWSIQRFWRRVWHQMLRRIGLTSATTCMKYLPLPDTKNGLITYKLIRCCIVFFLGGVVHMAGEKMLTGKLTFSWSFMCFILQPLGIAFECLVGYLWGRWWGTQQSPSKTPNRKASTSGRYHANGNNPRRFIMANGIEMGDESDPPLWIRCIGYIWVAIWFTWTAAYFVDPLCVMDMFSDPRLTRPAT